jgi:SAM-dependent methyltransferase
MKWVLPPVLYDALQRFVHGDHEITASLIRETYVPHKDRPALELGCGTGALCHYFQPGEYVGVDLDPARVEVARNQHPGYEFITGDASDLDLDFLSRFSFIFCHAWVHHIDDEGMRRILDQLVLASRHAGRPFEVLVLEPLLTDRPLLNPIGYAIAKLDRGKFVRPLRAMEELFGPALKDVRLLHGPWHWPIPGGAFRLRFSTK